MNIAVVTGASSGMGREFAKKIDSYNLDEIWAIALDREGLESLRGECKTKIKVLPLDLTLQESFDTYKKELEENKPNIQYLFNCSGYGKFGRYDEIEIKQSANMIDLNCKALMIMSELTIPYMTRGSKILEIASVAAYQPIPYMAVYGASKAFVLSYSRALSVELKSKGITVTCLCPFWTKTKFFDRARETNAKEEVVTRYLAMYTPEFVTKKGLKALNKGKLVVIPGFMSKVQCFLVSILPKKLVMKIWCVQQSIKKKYKNR